MRRHDFYEYAGDLIGRAFEVMHKADAEYASDADKFSNFKAQAEMQNMTPEDVAVTFLLKHIRSIAKGVSLREPMEGRIIDAINYLLLIAGMRRERAEMAQDLAIPETAHRINRSEIQARMS